MFLGLVKIIISKLPHRKSDADRRLDFIRLSLERDLKALGHNKTARELLGRYADLLNYDFTKLPVGESSLAFRARIGLDKHFKNKETLQ